MIALHGFLGLPSDWHDPAWDGLGLQPLDWMSAAPDEAPYLEQVAACVNEVASAGDILVGYSMGGRIALHALLASPNRWRGAVIVSASPGMRASEDRAARLASDTRWADRFRSDPWQEVIGDWNAQPVFRADPPDRLPRPEAAFDRTKLATALTLGSVAEQRDLRTDLARLPTPILWLAGERDPKYVDFAKEMANQNRAVRAEIVPGVGHRVPRAAPEAFRRLVESFVNEL